MSDKTGIEWCDATWNPVTGCAKVSQGCKHCYAERDWPRMTKLVPAYAGRDFTDVRTHGDRLVQPIRWAKRRMIFVNSMSDLFHPAVPDDFIDNVFGVMWACLYGRNGQPGHVFQILTKRPDRMREYLSTDRREAWARASMHYGGGIDPDGLYDQTMEAARTPHPRVWLGVSVEDQDAADERIPLLLDTPAAVRWISAEPLLGPVCLGEHGLHGGPGQLDWVVVGGESGPTARPMHPAWVRDLRDQCTAAGIPFLFKQHGEWLATDFCDDNMAMIPSKRTVYVRPSGSFHDGSEGIDFFGGDQETAWVGKQAAGRLLDGVLHDAYPKV